MNSVGQLLFLLGYRLALDLVQLNPAQAALDALLKRQMGVAA